MSLQTVGDFLLLFGWALPAVAAPVEYAFVRGEDGRRFGFRESALGRHLMAYMAAVGFLALLGAVRILTGDSLLWQVLRAVGFAALVAVTWWRWQVVHQARVAADRERDVTGTRGDAGPMRP